MGSRGLCRLLAALALLLGLAGATGAADWQDRLSKAEYPNIRYRMVQIAMRDGVKLSAAIWRPEVEGQRFPVVLAATPYNKLSERHISDAQFFAQRGYVYISYDLRGRYDSEGSAYLYGEQDGEDLDAVQSWIAAQPWSSGKIGMYGGSYLGFIQWEGALHQNPNLTALVPEVSPDDHYDNVFPSGAFQLSNSLDFLWFCCGSRTNVPIDVMDWPRWYRHLPITDLANFAGIQNTKLWNDLVTHPRRDAYWPGVGERIAPGKNGPGKYHLIQVPTFNISGWYDQVSQATINNYVGMATYGPEALRGRHKLMMGPWVHGKLFQTNQGDLTFPAQAAPNGLEWRLRWFDRWLKGIDNGFDKEPPINIYVMGADRWRSECEWPLARTRYTNYYLGSGGKANSLLGDGVLTTSPGGKEAPDAFAYDPKNPVPTLGGNVAMHPPRVGPYDQTSIELRSDVLVYSTPPLDADTEVTGPVVLRLFASTDRTDTDFTGKLIDVDPSGYAKILIEGVIRGRYNKTFHTENLLKPNEVNEFYVDLWSTSNVFRKGHRIRIEVSSSNFPKYDANPNTGHAFGVDTEGLIAHQRILHDRAHPSRVILPIIPAGSAACTNAPKS